MTNKNSGFPEGGEVKEEIKQFVWIKAIDKLPPHMIRLCLKIEGNPYSGYYDYSLNRFMCPNLGPQGISINDVEWLSESKENAALREIVKELLFEIEHPATSKLSIAEKTATIQRAKELINKK